MLVIFFYKFSEAFALSDLPKQFGWPKMKDERDLSGVKGLAMSNAALNQTLTQKERFSSEAIIAKYNLKQSLSTSRKNKEMHHVFVF